eukprot:2768432-Rhodomonas_salina.1
MKIATRKKGEERSETCCCSTAGTCQNTSVLLLAHAPYNNYNKFWEARFAAAKEEKKEEKKEKKRKKKRKEKKKKVPATWRPAPERQRRSLLGR